MKHNPHREPTQTDTDVRPAEAVLNAIYEFAPESLIKKPVLRKYQTPGGPTIHITDEITFHEVGYFHDGTTWNRCVIETAYLEANPQHFILID